MRHWQLTAIFLILLVSYIIFELKYSVSEQKISPQQVINMYNHQQAVIIDIRSKEAYQQGHILGALHVLPTELANKLKKLQKFSTKPVIIVCGIGRESPKFAQSLKKYGFEQVLLLLGGMQAWQAADLPVIKQK